MRGINLGCLKQKTKADISLSNMGSYALDENACGQKHHKRVQN